MKKIVPYTELEILGRVAERRAINYKIEEEKLNDKRLALDQYVSQRMEAAGLDKTLLSNPLSREILFNTFRKEFNYVRSPESEQTIQTLIDKANNLLPNNIKSESWKPGDCSCELHRIYDRNNPLDVQTFFKYNGECHKNLSIEILHDTIEEEVNRRALIHKFISENIANIDVSFEWEGKDTDRIIIINDKGMFSLQNKQLIKQQFKDTFIQKNKNGKSVDAFKFKDELSG